MENTKGEKMAQDLLNFLNSASIKDREDFRDTIVNDHRFLQQLAYDLFISVIKEFGKRTEYDARNEHAIVTSREISKLLEGGR